MVEDYTAHPSLQRHALPHSSHVSRAAETSLAIFPKLPQSFLRKPITRGLLAYILPQAPPPSLFMQHAFRQDVMEQKQRARCAEMCPYHRYIVVDAPSTFGDGVGKSEHLCLLLLWAAYDQRSTLAPLQFAFHLFLSGRNT